MAIFKNQQGKCTKIQEFINMTRQVKITAVFCEEK